MKPSCERVKHCLAEGWQTNYQLIEKCGATEAMRRLRELKSMGYPIERERIKANGRFTNTYRYRLKPGWQQTMLTFGEGERRTP